MGKLLLLFQKKRKSFSYIPRSACHGLTGIKTCVVLFVLSNCNLTSHGKIMCCLHCTNYKLISIVNVHACMMHLYIRFFQYIK